LIPAHIVADHVQMLTTEGNWKISDIVRVSGVAMPTLRSLCSGQRQTAFKITVDSVLALQPREEVRPPKLGMVPSTETIRLVRGMAAQGWSFPYIGEMLGGLSRSSAQKLAYSTEWVFAETAARVRVVAEKLRPFDLAKLDKPMPGMDIRVANKAREKNWVPLVAWYGQDIADPAAVPWKIQPTGSTLVTPVVRPTVCIDQDDDLPEVSPWSYIDPILTLRVADVAEAMRRTGREGGRRPEGYVPQLTHLTKIEAYAVTETAAKAGIPATAIGVMLGYRVGTKLEMGNAQRAVERMKATINKAREQLARLATGDKIDPDWLVQKESGNGVSDFPRIATAVLAVQDAPYGPGWTVTELAARAGMDEDAIRAFLTYATRRADTPYEVKHNTRSRPATCSEQSNLVVPVDLDAVLSA
jgi:hypothetical protein